MFDLDSSIEQWRRQMMAAGVKNPELIDELESHLRDDVEHRMSEGAGAAQAFEEAARRLGPGIDLHREFQNAKLNDPNLMKQKLRYFLAITAALAIGVGLILPEIAKWRAQEPLAASNVTLCLVGMVIVAFGVACATRGLVTALKNRHKA